MKQLQDIAGEQESMAIIVQLTNAFESIASARVAKIKTQVLEAQQFFDELWQIYQQLRVDNLFRFGRGQKERVIDKELLIMITAEGGFGGDIDQRLVDLVLGEYNPTKHDIIVIGHHGALLLEQASVNFKKYYKLPIKDQNINVEPLIREVRQYKSTVAFYQTYVSLMTQNVKRIEIGAAVQAQGKNAGKADEIISEMNYIFEPSIYSVVAHLERSMLQITLAQLIFDSKLAQYASRFRAMTAANDRANESLGEIKSIYRRTRREIRDERLKEIISGMKKASAQ
jgi:ATP synthase F1 gamma subunit